MRKKVLILGLCLLGVTHSLSSKDKKSIPLSSKHNREKSVKGASGTACGSAALD